MTKRWYVVHAYSGFEKQVKRSLEDRVRRGVRALGDRVARQVGLREPAEGPAAAVDEQPVGHVRGGHPRPDLGGGLAGGRECGLPEIDVADPHQRQSLQGPVGADEVLDEGIRGVHQEL